MDAAERIDALVAWIRQASARAQGLLVPISGGSDSALGFLLCAAASSGKTIAIHAGSRATLRCAAWFEDIGEVIYARIPGGVREIEEMRWARFLAVSLRDRAWLVGCRNRTEDELGTYSLASRVATFLPLVGTHKSDVMRMCEVVGVPEEILVSSRRADPDCGRPAEMAEIPFETIDAFLTGEPGPTEAQRTYLSRIAARNAFKRTLPIRGPKL